MGNTIVSAGLALCEQNTHSNLYYAKQCRRKPLALIAGCRMTTEYCRALQSMNSTEGRSKEIHVYLLLFSVDSILAINVK